VLEPGAILERIVDGAFDAGAHACGSAADVDRSVHEEEPIDGSFDLRAAREARQSA
jgi:hypothetical protein